MSVHPYHPWHFIPVGPQCPSVVTAIIEIPRGSKNKYEIDKKSGMLFLDRVMSSSVFYPVNYGFIPQTYCEDGDALDVMVLNQEPSTPLSMMNARVIGGMKMRDGGDSDDKILAVHADDPHFKHIKTWDDFKVFHPHLVKEIEHFFKTYKLLDNKTVEVLGWFGKEEAEKIILESMQLYQDNKSKLTS